MYSGTPYEMLASYNEWMNEQLYAAAARLSDEQRKQDLRAFFKSIHGTFEHLLRVDQIWLARFAGEPIPPASKADFAFPNFQELWAARKACDQQLTRWAASLSAEWLAGAYSWKAVLYDKTFTMPGFAVAAQIFNHQTHHRGQVTTLLLQLDIDPGVTDIPMLPALRALEA